ncbi:hypothetical protein O6H91_02G154300 [Diphasiastrum complanatum]|uniref:Uncharacterized protein n=1 Tax=Diphasiastrum complanatum TaxID=34168 RepID=A0ACC2EM96_DIPCM|nr:hypothetical protein O6H91_02G154300 [Diphasiastrum complanatum]
MELQEFFSTSSLDHHPPLLSSPSPSSCCHAMLSGPPRSGKSSLLFQFAYNKVLAEQSAAVIFICRRHSFEYSPPYLAEGIDPASQVWERVHLKYVSDDEDLRNFFAAFHLQRVLPRAVIVDDFSTFFNGWKYLEQSSEPRAREKAMVKTLALCHDAINYAK